MSVDLSGFTPGYRLLAAGLLYYAVLLPFQPTFLPASAGIIIAGIGWLHMLISDRKRVTINKISLSVYSSLVLYYLSGVSLSEHSAYLEILRVQIPLLFWGLPFVIYYKDFKEKFFDIFLRFFVVSSALSALIFIGYFLWLELQDISMEYSKRSPYYFLPVHYLGMYFNSAVVFVLWGNLFSNIRFKILMFSVLSIAIIILSSRMQWLIYFILTSTFLICMILQKKIHLKIQFILLLLMPLFIFFQIPEVKRRLMETKDEIRSLKTKVNDKQTNHRKFIWRESLAIIREAPVFGFKPGLADQLLMKRLSSVDEKFWDGKQVYYLRDGNYNYHNQFLQGTAERGAGVLALIGALLITFLSSRSLAARLCVIVIFFSMLTESILQRQSGVFFVATFLPFLASHFNHE